LFETIGNKKTKISCIMMHWFLQYRKLE